MAKYWFRPKKYGMGAYPTTWQGWVFILCFVIYLLLISMYLQDGNVGAYIFYFILGLTILIYVSYKKTEGGWHWKWGKNL